MNTIESPTKAGLKNWCPITTNVSKARPTDQSQNLFLFQKGLFQGNKRNIERMGEAAKDSGYHSLHHFISESPRDARAVMGQSSPEVNALPIEGGHPVAFIIDEGGHPKKGLSAHGGAAQMQAQGYFVERPFQGCKPDIGMGGYQIRGWVAWHRHMAMCMMAQACVLSGKILLKKEMPQMGAYDIRMVSMWTYTRKDNDYEGVLSQIKYRHLQKKRDMFRRNGKT